MAESIDMELVNFKTKVEGSLPNMETTITNLETKIERMLTLTNSAKDSFSIAYVSKNTAQVTEKFTEISGICTKVSSSVESDLKKLYTDSSELVTKVKKLEELKKEIEEQENNIKNAGSYRSYNSDGSNKSAVDAHNAEVRRKINAANEILNVKRPEFNNLHNEAKSLLATLKSFDTMLPFVTEFKPVDISLLSQYFVGSSFKKMSYKASNGETIEYYLYVPEYSTEVSDLPVHLYLHGSGGFEDVLYGSLPYYLAKKDYQANSIIICPQGEGSNWRDLKYQAALMELTNNVVSTYKADSNRVSISGHSMGAIGGYELISRNPNYFSAFIPIAGNNDWMDKSDAGYAALGDVKIWAFHGTKDKSVEYEDSTKVLKELTERGYSNMTLETLEGEGHNIQEQIYYDEFQIDGQSVIPFEWCLSQVKGD